MSAATLDEEVQAAAHRGHGRGDVIASIDGQFEGVEDGLVGEVDGFRLPHPTRRTLGVVYQAVAAAVEQGEYTAARTAVAAEEFLAGAGIALDEVVLLPFHTRLPPSGIVLQAHALAEGLAQHSAVHLTKGVGL